MNDLLLFPLAQYWGIYLAFVVFLAGILTFELGLLSRGGAQQVSLRQAGLRSVGYVLLALIFNVALYFWMLHSFPARADLAGLDHAHLAADAALEFLAGYVVEYALAIDNVFVFVAVFSYFAVPQQHQQKVLFYGILGAVVLRAVFISLGAVLMQYHWVVIGFGVFLLLTGVKILFLPEKPLDPEKNPLVRLIRRVVPVTPTFHGERFTVRIDGRLWFTPLFVALAFIELSDVIFAVDSVPAIFALTNEPLIVFTSNIFAILGLRSLFFVLQYMVKAFTLLKYGLGLILIFVGLKMVWLNGAFDGKFPITWSLGIIGAILGGSVLASLALTRWRPEQSGDG